MEAATGIPRIGEGAEPIESIEWLRGFAEGYVAAWNAGDPQAVAACATEDVVWTDPALAEPARGRAEVAEFAVASLTAFPDLRFDEPGDPAMVEDGSAAYVPWVMSGTNSGPIDPPGFAPTGRSISITGLRRLAVPGRADLALRGDLRLQPAGDAARPDAAARRARRAGAGPGSAAALEAALLSQISSATASSAASKSVRGRPPIPGEVAPAAR